VGVGLHAHERRFVRVYGPFSFFLFMAGASSFYFLILPIGLEALLSPTADILIDGYPLIDASLLLDDYFKFVAWMTLIFGVAFETPLVVLFLARTGIIPLDTLARKQKWVIMIMVVLGAVLTPTGDPISMALMTIPLMALYELGLLLAWLAGRKERREHPDWYGPYKETKDDAKNDGAGETS
jgi:sec-independent protein translocase protein TatC